MKRFVFSLLVVFLLFPQASGGAEGFLYFEGTAATVNREVLFFSDILLEQCFLKCGVMQAGAAEELSLPEARERLIADTLALQENGKLALGHVDNVALAEQVQEAGAKLALCESPCRRNVSQVQVAKWIERKAVIQDFLRNRVGVFVEVSEEEVRREFERRSAQKKSAAGLSVEEVRREIRERKIGREMRNWYTRTASKATITLSPLEGK